MDQDIIYILIDGECVLCEKAALVLDRKLKTTGAKRFCLGSLQSKVHQEKTGCTNRIDTSTPLSSIVVIHGQQVFTESKAIFHLSRYMRFPHRVLGIFKWLPRMLTDAIYRWIARNRYRWFGKKSACMLPGSLQHLEPMDS